MEFKPQICRISDNSEEERVKCEEEGKRKGEEQRREEAAREAKRAILSMKERSD